MTDERFEQWEIWQGDVPGFGVWMQFDIRDQRTFEKLARALRRAFYYHETPLSEDSNDTLADCLREHGGMIARRLDSDERWYVWFDADDRVRVRKTNNVF